jgi:hypothetical protein
MPVTMQRELNCISTILRVKVKWCNTKISTSAYALAWNWKRAIMH